MTAVVFPPAVDVGAVPAPVPAALSANRFGALARGFVYYTLLGGGMLFPLLAGIVALIRV